MHYRICHRFRLAASAVLIAALAPTYASAAPTVAFKAPASNAALSGAIGNSSACEVSGTNLRKVRFYLDGSTLNTAWAAPWRCSIDTRKFGNGAHVLRAVAYDAIDATATARVAVTIRNVAASTAAAPVTAYAPSIGFTAPNAGSVLAGVSTATMAASDRDGRVTKVQLYVGTTLVGSASATPYRVSFDTRRFANGTRTLMAVATDNTGKQSTTQRNVVFRNITTSASAPAPATAAQPASGPISAGDILGWARADVPFAQQAGYSGQVLGTYPPANSIPESGIRGSVLPDGETLRLGKVIDPTNSLKHAFAFQLAPGDRLTSGSRRSEIAFTPNVQFGKVYWVAFKVFVYDWGSLPAGDNALFGTQLHSGDSNAGYSPSFAIYTSGNGRNFQVQVRGSGLPGTQRYADQPIPFGRWIDFVFKVRESTGADGLLQGWMNGNQIVNHSGPIGYRTAYNDYFKFGYYNWSAGFKSPRKVLLRMPVIVLDPSGSKYSAASLRSYIDR